MKRNPRRWCHLFRRYALHHARRAFKRNLRRRLEDAKAMVEGTHPACSLADIRGARTKTRAQVEALRHLDRVMELVINPPLVIDPELPGL